MGMCFLLALLLGFGVDLVELDAVELLALDQVGLARIVDLDLLQHLTDDHLDVLVVDADALQPVDLLDFVDQIGGEILDAFDRQNVVRCRVAFDDKVALLNDIAVLDMDVLALRDQVLDRLGILLLRLDGDAPLVLVVASEPHRAGDFRDDRRLLRPARLEQLRHPRQTAGDVARLGAFGRNAGDDVAGLHLGAGFDRDDGIDRELIARVAAAAQLGDLAVLALDHDRRTQVGTAAGRAPIDDHALGDAGRLVERFRHRLAIHQVLEAGRALDHGEDRTGVGIPLRDALAALDLVALGDPQPRAVRNAVHGPLGSVRIDHGDHNIASHGDPLAIGILHDILALVL